MCRPHVPRRGSSGPDSCVLRAMIASRAPSILDAPAQSTETAVYFYRFLTMIFDLPLTAAQSTRTCSSS